MNVNTSVKQVAVVLKGEPMTQQILCTRCATAFLKSYYEAEEEWVKKWNNGGYMKVVLKCTDTTVYTEIFNKVISRGIPYAIEKNVLAIGPFSSTIIDELTGKLKLY